MTLPGWSAGLANPSVSSRYRYTRPIRIPHMVHCLHIRRPHGGGENRLDLRQVDGAAGVPDRSELRDGVSWTSRLDPASNVPRNPLARDVFDVGGLRHQVGPRVEDVSSTSAWLPRSPRTSAAASTRPFERATNRCRRYTVVAPSSCIQCSFVGDGGPPRTGDTHRARVRLCQTGTQSPSGSSTGRRR